MGILEMDFERILAVPFFIVVVTLSCCASDREFLLKFEAVGHEFSKILRLLEQFIQTEQF